MDTSVWVAHFRTGIVALDALVALDRVLVHPMVIAEIAFGTPPRRQETLSSLRQLRLCEQATLAEVIAFVEAAQLYGNGCGLVDLSLLASVRITPGAMIWTLDKNLGALAHQYGVRYEPELAH